MTELGRRVDPDRRVWRAPRLVPLAGLVDAATGTSTFLVETQQASTLYAPLPS